MYASESTISLQEKLLLARNLAAAMRYLHEYERGALYHGHLNPFNIFVSCPDSFSVQITDLGLSALIKHARIFTGYKMHTVWSAPECLQTKGQLELSAQVDIYSFGMILWEILHETVPFDNDWKNIANYVVKEDMRPKILPIIPQSVAGLIRNCWQKDPTKRPHSFNEICQQLNKILND